MCSVACFSVLLISFWYTPPASAQVNGFDLSDPANQNLIRARYSRSPELPDGLAYASTLNLARELNSIDSGDAEFMVATEMGLDEESAKDFLAIVLAAAADFDEQMAKRIESISCDNGVPRSRGDDAFLLTTSGDDARAAYSEQHLAQFKVRLNKDLASRFQHWLDSAKLNITHVTFDHKELARVSGITNVDRKMTALCASYAEAARGEFE
jgi:hypothetical protein